MENEEQEIYNRNLTSRANKWNKTGMLDNCVSDEDKEKKASLLEATAKSLRIYVLKIPNVLDVHPFKPLHEQPLLGDIIVFFGVLHSKFRAFDNMSMFWKYIDFGFNLSLDDIDKLEQTVKDAGGTGILYGKNSDDTKMFQFIRKMKFNNCIPHSRVPGMED